MTKPALRVLLLLDKLEPGGAQRHVARLVRGLRGRGVDAQLACLDRLGRWGEALAAEGVPAFALGCPAIVPPAGLTAAWRLRRLLRQVRPTILHCLLFDANVLGPLVWRWAGLPGAVLTSRRDTGFWHARRHWLALRFAGRWTDRIAANSRAVAAECAVHEGFQIEQTAIIPNAVDPAPYRLARPIRAELGLAADEFTVLCVARLRPEKGQATLLRALAQLSGEVPPTRLLLAGDGPEEERLKNLSRELGVSGRVNFLGSREDIPALLASVEATALVSSSEGFSNFLLESLAAGKPSVASAVEGTPEAVTDGQTGLLVPADDPTATAAALRRLRDNPELRQRLGQAGQADVQARFAPECELEAYMALYRQMLG